MRKGVHREFIVACYCGVGGRGYRQEARRHMRNLRAVGVIGLLALLIAAIAVFFLAGEPSLWVRALVVLVAIFAIGFLIRIGYAYQWTGFGEEELPKPENREVRPKKTLWDWLQLCGALAIPIVITIFGLWFTTQQETRQQAIEDRRAASERKLEEERADDAALQAYLDEMSTLLLDEDLRTSKDESEVRTLARARTKTVLEMLDPVRRTEVMKFLYEAVLVQRVDEGDPIIGLRGANLEDANLPSAHLCGAKLRNADLRGANLRNADLRGANLRGANLRGADLLKAELGGAKLRDADLSRAKGIKNEELDQSALSLAGATMPNGQKYEEWLKSKGRGVDGENAALSNGC
jgi:hypothetical protein